MMANLTPASIREVLSDPSQYSGWFYLPSGPWALDTVGAFLPYEKDANRPKTVNHDGTLLSITIDSDAIEDVVYNINDQIESPELKDLLSAFVFYCKNDAFIVID